MRARTVRAQHEPRKGVRHMLRQYRRPEIVEYGRIEQLTQGDSGTKPDYVFTGIALIDTNTDCSDPGSTIGCLLS